MKKIFFIGDTSRHIGSSIVNLGLYKSYKGPKFKSRKINSLDSLFQLGKEFFSSKVVHIGEVSLFSVFYAIIAKLAFKKITFLMHAGVILSCRVNDYPRYSYIFEFIILCLSNVIFVPSRIYLNEVLKNRIYIKCSSKYVVIHNGVDVPPHKQSQSNKDTFSIITVGGGRREKGILNICKAIENIPNRRIILYVVGREGPDTKEINSYAFVRNVGLIEHSQFIDLMTECSLFIQNSEFETFSIAAVEAIACNCSIILSNKVGSAELFSRKHNYILDNNRIENLSKRITEIIDNPNSESALKDFNFDMIYWDNVVERYNRVWREL